MSFFFVDTPLFAGQQAKISGDAAHHIAAVRRMKAGEEVELQDPSGARFLCRIDAVTKRTLEATPLTPLPLPLAPSRSVTLLQAHIAEQKLDLVLQKATELGATRIVIWQAEHSPHGISTDRLAHKTERFAAIMQNACEQSGRPDVPALAFADSLASALALLSDETPILLEAGGGAALPAGSLALIVGPEGGFSPGEIALCAEREMPSLALGTYTLRAETAAIAALAKAL